MSTVYVGHATTGKDPVGYIAKSVNGGVTFAATGFDAETAIPLCLYHFTENIGICLAAWWGVNSYVQIYKTTDGWATHSLIKSELIGGDYSERYWNEIRYGTGVLLAVADYNILFRSTDNGDTWTKISTGLPTSTTQKLTGLSYAGGTWFIMAINGASSWRVIHSHDEGLTWDLGTSHAKPGGAAGTPGIGHIWMGTSLAGWLGWYDFFSTADMGETTTLVSDLRLARVEYPLVMLYAEGDDYSDVDLYKINGDGSITKICDLVSAYCTLCKMMKAPDGTIYLNTGFSNTLYSSDGVALTTLGSVDAEHIILCEYALAEAAPIIAAKSLWRVERVDDSGRSPRNVGRSVR